MKWLAIVLLVLACTSEEEAYLNAFPYEDYDVVDVPGVGKFYLDDNPARVKATLRAGRRWEPRVLEQLAEHIEPGSTVLDVGAHIGSITIPMANLVGPEGHVYAFEPQRKIHRELVYNLRLNNLTNVTALRFAIGSVPGVVEMDPVDIYDGEVRVGSGGDEVEVRTIDSFGFTDVSVMKVDVEGYQLEVLKGARETIEASRPVLIAELGSQLRTESFELLKSLGYEWEELGDQNYLCRPISEDRESTSS